MKHYIILLCTLCIIIFSCSQKSTFVLPEYQNIVINESTLAIAPLPAKPQLEYPDDLGTELGFEISDDLYLSSLNEKLPVSMRSLSKFEEVVSISYKNIPKLQPCSLKLKNDELISLSLPVGKIKFDSVQTDFTLFMDKLNIKITKDRDVSSSLSKNYTVSGNHPDNASYTNIKRYTYYLCRRQIMLSMIIKPVKLSLMGKSIVNQHCLLYCASLFIINVSKIWHVLF